MPQSPATTDDMSPGRYLARLRLLRAAFAKLVPATEVGASEPKRLATLFQSTTHQIQQCNTRARADELSPEKVCNDALVACQEHLLAKIKDKYRIDSKTAKQKLDEVAWALSSGQRQKIESRVVMEGQTFLRRSTPIGYLLASQYRDWLRITDTAKPQWFDSLDPATQNIFIARVQQFKDNNTGLGDESSKDIKNRIALAEAIGHLSCSYRGVPGITNCWLEETFAVGDDQKLRLLDGTRRIRVATPDAYEASDRSQECKRNIQALVEVCQHVHQVVGDDGLPSSLINEGHRMTLQTLVANIGGEGEMVENLQTATAENPQTRLIRNPVSNAILDKKRSGLTDIGVTKAHLNGSQTQKAVQALLAMQGGQLDGTPSVLGDDYEYAYAAALQEFAVTEIGDVAVGGCKSAKDRKGAQEIYASAIATYQALHPKHPLPMPPSLSPFNEPTPEWEELEYHAATWLATEHDYRIAETNCPGCFGIKDAPRVVGERVMEKAKQIQLVKFSEPKATAAPAQSRSSSADARPSQNEPYKKTSRTQRLPDPSSLANLNSVKPGGERYGGGFLHGLASFMRGVRITVLGGLANFFRMLWEDLTCANTEAAAPNATKGNASRPKGG